MINILVICIDNGPRSQIAHAYLRELLNEDVNIYSAGSIKSPKKIRKVTIEIMKEVNIDISNHTTNSINEYRDIKFDYIISLCEDDTESCPYFPSNAKIFHEDIPDPSSMGSTIETNDEFRIIRKKIKDMCVNFVDKNIPMELRSNSKVY